MNKEVNISGVVNDYYSKKMNLYKKLIIITWIANSIFSALITYRSSGFFDAVMLSTVVLCFSFLPIIFLIEKDRVSAGNHRIISDDLLEFIADSPALDISYKEELGRRIEDSGLAVSFSTLKEVELKVLSSIAKKERKSSIGSKKLIDMARNSSNT